MVERAAFSAATAPSRIASSWASSLASSLGLSERMSYSVKTSAGMEFTETPPPVTLAE